MAQQPKQSHKQVRRRGQDQEQEWNKLEQANKAERDWIAHNNKINSICQSQNEVIEEINFQLTMDDLHDSPHTLQITSDNKISFTSTDGTIIAYIHQLLDRIEPNIKKIREVYQDYVSSIRVQKTTDGAVIKFRMANPAAAAASSKSSSSSEKRFRASRRHNDNREEESSSSEKRMRYYVAKPALAKFKAPAHPPTLPNSKRYATDLAINDKSDWDVVSFYTHSSSEFNYYLIDVQATKRESFAIGDKVFSRMIELYMKNHPKHSKELNEHGIDAIIKNIYFNSKLTHKYARMAFRMMHKVLTNVIANAPGEDINGSFTVYRGISPSRNSIGELKYVRFNYFISTSTNARTAHGFSPELIYIISVPYRSKYLYVMEHTSQGQDEQEILLPDTAVFKVKSNYKNAIITTADGNPPLEVPDVYELEMVSW